MGDALIGRGFGVEVLAYSCRRPEFSKPNCRIVGIGRKQESRKMERSFRKHPEEINNQAQPFATSSWSLVGTATASRKVDAVDDEKDGQLHIYPWLVLDWYWRCSAACMRLRFSTITPCESIQNSRPSPTRHVSSMDKRKRLGLQSETMH